MAMGSVTVLPTGERMDWAKPSGEPLVPGSVKARGWASAMDAETAKVMDSGWAPAVVTASDADLESVSVWE